METIVIDNNEWFNLSDKLTKLTLTDGKTYLVQAHENQILCHQGAAVPTDDHDGLLLNPIIQAWKFTFATGDIIALRVGNFLNLTTQNHITIAEVK